MAENKKYVVVTGMDSTKGRLEPGEPFAGHAKSLQWLIEQGHVVEDGSDEHKQLVAELDAAKAATAATEEEE